ncbi:MAG: VWA domain-containing protein [Candidatus Aenigmarchaeota archaeon]|nr:VWA domain-containing protein [Candidatus Aenigmarchaeota archaeon]
MSLPWKKGSSASFKLSLCLITLILLAFCVNADTYSAFCTTGTEIYTDKPDYEPGETVNITGHGFLPKAPLNITITRPDRVTDSCGSSSCYFRFLNGTLISDREGSFFDYLYLLNGITGNYTVRVTDGKNYAEFCFMDGRNITNVTLDGLSSVSVLPSASITAAVTLVSTSGSYWRSTMYQIEGESAVCVDTPDHTESGTHTYTEPFSITAPSAPGVYDASFIAYLNNDCTGSSPSNTYTLIDGITVTSDAVCGDGEIEAPESCDDANTDDADGCSSSCQVESGWSCAGEPSSCAEVCGNGIITATEECDDANTDDSDGCGSSCAIEAGWSCTGEPSECLVYNPALPSSCGIDIALIIDNSGSIDNSELTAMKNAFKGFVDAFLPDTPTHIAVVKFNTDGDLVLDYSGDATEIKNAIDSVSTSDGYTNWDDGLKEAQDEFDNSPKPDLYVFASDGQPNRHGDPAVDGEPESLAAAIERANQLKLSGVRIITLGIGVTGDGASNLKAISSEDAYYSSGFDTLADDLADLADELCGGTITVRKLVDGSPAGGWEFSASVTDGESIPATSTTGEDGFIDPVFDINITDTVSTVDITETPKQGYNFVSAACKDQDENPVGTPGVGTVTGIVIGPNDAVYCEFNNSGVLCSEHSNSESCEEDEGCKWCPSCNNPFRNVYYPLGNCISESAECAWNGCSVECGAECDTETPCLPKQDENYCYYGGECNSSCLCGYLSQFCPPPGTEDNGTCYYGEQSCTENGCQVTSAEMSCPGLVCDEILGPVDMIGPVTSNFTADPIPPQFLPGPLPAKWLVNISALETEDCSNVSAAEYFVSKNVCYYPPDTERGTPMGALDGSFGGLVELVNTTHTFNEENDGLYCFSIRGKNDAGYWGNIYCDCINVDTQVPLDPTNVTLTPYICNQNRTLNAKVCDAESDVVGGEYYFDIFTDWIPGGQGLLMYVQSQYVLEEPEGRYFCANLNATIDVTNVSDGCHWVRLHGVDDAGNWGKPSPNYQHKFILDKTPPRTNKMINGTVIPCDLADDGEGNALDAGCFYTVQGTEILLEGFDDLGSQNESCRAESLTTWYRIRWRNNWTSPWEDWSIWTLYREPIVLREDSIHEIEYYSEDSCGNAETHHYELDIVDTAEPKTEKTIEGVRLEGDGQTFDWWITQESTIILNCTDTDPHPVSGVTLYWRYKVDGGNFTGWNEVFGGYDAFSYPEDSVHTLEYYCTDILGNREETQVEVDKVDTTPPETNKTYGWPLFDTDGSYPKWINSSTPVTLESTDGGEICAVGVDKTYWMNTIVNDYMCEEAPLNCQPVHDFEDEGWTEYTAPFYKTETSCHLIEYWSEDRLGNRERIKAQCVFVDNEPPVSVKGIQGPQIETDCREIGEGNYSDGCYYVTTETEVTLECRDSLPHPVGNVDLFYKIDWKNATGDTWISGTWIKSTNPVTFSYENDSFHLLEWYCIDALGNAEEVRTELDMVDSSPPEVVKQVNGALMGNSTIDWYLNGTSNITLNCTDVMPHPVGDVTLNWTLYWSEECIRPDWEELASGVTDGYKSFTSFRDSCHKLVYWCSDALENTGPLTEEIDAVDTKPPVSWKDINGTYVNCTEGEVCDKWITQNTLLELYCEDQAPHPVGGVKIYYRYFVDDVLFQDWTEYTRAINYGEDSVHRLEWYCVDALGNKEETQVEIDKVDTTPPEMNKIIGEPKIECTEGEGCDYWLRDHYTNITLDPVDGGDVCAIDRVQCDYWYLVNNTTWEGPFEYRGPIVFTEDCLHELHISCRDALGNVVNDTELFRVDSQPPVTVKSFIGPKYPASEKDEEQFELTEEQAENFWMRDHVTVVELNATDTIEPCAVGIRELWYRVGKDMDGDEMVDGLEMGNWSVVTGSYVNFTVNEDCLHKIEWYSVDMLGNTEEKRSQYHRVDSTPPVTTKTFDGPTWDDTDKTNPYWENYWVSNETDIILLAVDEASPCAVGVDYIHYELWWDSDGDGEVDMKIDDENASSSIVTINLERDCIHKIVWYAVDLLGNPEDEHIQYHKVDQTPPRTYKLIEGSMCNATEEDLELFNLTLDEEIESFWLTSNSTITLSAVEGMTNCSSGLDHLHYEVWYSEDGTGDEWVKLDEQDVPANGSSELNTTLTLGEDCLHKIVWYAVDRVENIEKVHIQYHRVDNHAPEILKEVGWPSIYMGKNPQTGEDAWDITTDTPISLDGTYDALEPCASGRTKIEYSIWYDGSGIWDSWKTYTGEFNLLGDSTHRLKVRVTDCLGNTVEDIETFVVHENLPGEECKVPIKYSGMFGWEWRSVEIPEMMVDLYTNDSRMWNVMKLMEGQYDIIYFQDYLTGDWTSYDPERLNNETGEPMNSLNDFDQGPGKYYIKLKDDARYMSYFVIFNDLREGCSMDLTECWDRLDNDADGYWDYPYDTECLDREDGLEISVCGNGITERFEECDDNNTQGGDGCSEECTLELVNDSCVSEKGYTLNADFDEGTLSGLEHTTVPDQLQIIEGQVTTYPILWVANAGEDSVSKWDTSQNRELARYHTWFGVLADHGAWSGAAPSRTAVDTDGNCYVANRHFDDYPADVIKILANDWIDRNGNGIMDTSYDANNNSVIEGGEMLPMNDTNGNERIDPEEITDERVAWVATVGPSSGLGRGLAIDLEGNIWLGLFNERSYYKLNGTDGSVIQGPIYVGAHTPYGALVDRYGFLWGASLDNNLLKLDTNTGNWTIYTHSGSNYGIALGYDSEGSTQVYLGYHNPYLQFNSSDETFSQPATSDYYSYGVATDSEGNILSGSNSDGRMGKYAPDGSLIWLAPAQVASEIRGTVVDSDDNVWAIHRGDSKMAKFNGTDGSPLGVFDTGLQPYTYSDASGLGLRGSISVGVWTVVFDSKKNGTSFDAVSWTGYSPNGTSITVKVRSSSDNLSWSSWETAQNGVSLSTTPDGRYLQVEATLKGVAGSESPILYDLSVQATCSDDLDARIDSCTDLDGDGYSIEGEDCGPVDCNDGNNASWRVGTFYYDGDEDGFHLWGEENQNEEDLFSICYGSEIPIGYSESTSGRDCDDDDSAVSPAAQEICNNTIDDDCDGLVDCDDEQCEAECSEEESGNGAEDELSCEPELTCDYGICADDSWCMDNVCTPQGYEIGRFVSESVTSWNYGCDAYCGSTTSQNQCASSEGDAIGTAACGRCECWHDTETSCADELDNDCDELIDCDDPDCSQDDNCIPV